MVPCLALECRKLRKRRELIRLRLYQRELTLFRHNEQQALIGQQDHLAVTVSLAFPLELAVLEIDARQRAAIKTVSMSIMNDEIVEPGIQFLRRPALLNGPAAGSLRDGETSYAATIAHANQNVASRGRDRLHDRNTGPCMFPQQLAVSRPDTGRAL